MALSLELTDECDFRNQFLRKAFTHRALRVNDDRSNIRGCSMPEVHDDVGVYVGDLGMLQPRMFERSSFTRSARYVNALRKT